MDIVQACLDVCGHWIPYRRGGYNSVEFVNYVNHPSSVTCAYCKGIRNSAEDARAGCGAHLTKDKS